MGLNAVVSWPKEEWGFDPVGFAEMRPGAYDIHERVRDMNRNGVLASMCFPTFAGFAGGMFQEAADKDLALATVQAYNDWHIDEWCARLPRPLHPARHPADLGPAAGGRRGAPGRGQGLPRDHDARAAAHPGPARATSTSTTGTRSSARCRRSGVVMCLHIGQGFDAINSAPDAPIDNLIILATQVSALAAQDLLWGGAFRTYPDLKVAWSEAGIGWIPFYLDRCDRHYTNQRWLGSRLRRQAAERHLPRALARVLRHRPVSLKVRARHRHRHHRLGVRLPALRLDLARRARGRARASSTTPGASDADIHQITWENSCRFFGYDPFEHIAREDATVGQAAGALARRRHRRPGRARSGAESYEAAHAG